MKKTVKVLVTQSCPTLYDPMDCSLLGSSVHGSLQARILDGVPLPSPPRKYQWLKNPPANARHARNVVSISGLGRSPGGGQGNSLQYSCLETPMDRGAWRATVHRVTQSWTRLKQLSTHTYTCQQHQVFTNRGQGEKRERVFSSFHCIRRPSNVS